MSRALILVAAGACLSLGGCLGLQTDDPYPVSGNPVNPTPVPGYAVQCQSEPSPFSFAFNDYLTACQQVYKGRQERVIVRARG
ncbi:MAG: hypothetical protein JO048_01040 [Methylobacteriaceae bacterium]|nr:hypothetical protein [Methylobacteriaceae bacterium]